MKFYWIVAAAALFAAAWLLANYFRLPDYEVVSVPVNDVFAMQLGGGPEDCVSAINDRGQVAGHYQLADGKYCAYIWDEDNGLIELPKIKCGSCYITDINNKGQAVGWISVVIPSFFGESVAFFRDVDGTITRLPLEDKAHAYASGINDKGQVAGIITTPDTANPGPFRGKRRVFIWDKIGGMRIIDEIGDKVMNVCGINEAGQIAGLTGHFVAYKTFVWSESAGLVHLDVKARQIFDIDQKGNVLGQTVYKEKLFLCSQSKEAKKFSFGDYGHGKCRMNEKGDIVGSVHFEGIRFLNKYQLVNGHTESFLHTGSSKTVVFDRFFEEGENFHAIDINNNGWIVGYVLKRSNSKRRVVILRKTE